MSSPKLDWTAEGGCPHMTSQSLNRDSEARRSLVNYRKSSFQRDPCLTQLAFFEQTSNQSYSVRNAPRRRKLRQWVIWVRSPITPRLGNFYKSCTQGERWMTSEVGDGQHFIPQRGHEQQIDF